MDDASRLGSHGGLQMAASSVKAGDTNGHGEWANGLCEKEKKHAGFAVTRRVCTPWHGLEGNKPCRPGPVPMVPVLVGLQCWAWLLGLVVDWVWPVIGKPRPV